MKKYYDYSVKDVLQHYFPGNTVEKMRGYSEDHFYILRINYLRAFA